MFNQLHRHAQRTFGHAGRRALAVLGAGFLATALAACSSAPGRPVLESSAVEAGAAGGAAATSDLDFFDALEQRRLVCHDDVLHAALLLGNGLSAPTYTERVALARRLGYVDAGFDRPAHEAATIGEVARIMLRITDGPGSTSRLTQEQAVLRLAGRGLMPAGARPYQGLTGAQLLTVLGGVRTAMGDRARPHVQLSADARPPAPAPPAAAQPPAPQGASPTAEPGASAMASAEGGSPARAEPLPPGATDASIERAPQPPSPSAPQGGQANVAEVRHAEPLPPPPPRPAKPRVWVPGKPLRKPGN